MTAPSAIPPSDPKSTPHPLGAQVRADGVNFAVHAPDALGLDLLLFDESDPSTPTRTLSLKSERDRTGAIWHTFVEGLGHGQVYAWRARGPRGPGQGMLFDSDKVLLDPYTRAVYGMDQYRRETARARGDNTARSLRSVVVDTDLYDWEGDRPLPRPGGREVIYEMHPAGFTRSPSSGLDEGLRGTYRGFIEKIPYLKDLGVTAVEFLPIQQFDDQDSPAGRRNVWGYSTLAFFAPHAQYSSDRRPTAPVDEFRDLVKALHRAGLRVILDVVYNHTAEGGPDGPVLSFRGLDNRGYYLQAPDGRGYLDYTGCGNTVNANSGAARRLILDSLRYWVQDMHVDGFRFDLGSALTRGRDGSPLEHPPLIDDIESDPLLAGTTLIAEPWDTGGLFQVSSFPGRRFAVWNGPFEDISRAFWKGDEGTIEGLMARIVGSPDTLGADTRRPSHGVNYVTCHDGFCLADLVSYEQKHNLDNGEENRDGSNHNISCNHGHEGPTEDRAIQEIRSRQIRNFLTLLFLSHGTPMLWMGDEVRHTRRGNNNPWNQDNELNWLDWNQVEAEKPLRDFVRGLIAFTGKRKILQEDRFWSATSPQKPGDITWHGRLPGKPDWRPSSRVIAYALSSSGSQERVLVFLNASAESVEFTLPDLDKGYTRTLVLDTSAAPGEDMHPAGKVLDPAPEKKIMPSKSVFVLLDRAQKD